MAEHSPRLRAIAAMALLSVLEACGPLPGVVSSTPYEITLKTGGDLALSETRARAYCGRRLTGLLDYTAHGPDQIATFRCL